MRETQEAVHLRSPNVPTLGSPCDSHEVGLTRQRQTPKMVTKTQSGPSRNGFYSLSIRNTMLLMPEQVGEHLWTVSSCRMCGTIISTILGK